MKTQVIRIHETGGPEVLRWETVDLPAPGPGQALLRQTTCGVNYIDTYHRSGLYPLPLPAVVGSEGAGTVEAVGPGVTDIRPGMRAAYAGERGGYAEARLVPAERLVPLPDDVSDEIAAGMMLRGMTAQYLLRRTFPVKRGDAVLIHAAAGGVGLLMCQWARSLGATVIGTVGSDAKAELARAHGCEHAIVYTREDFTVRVREVTGGRGVQVVYDAVGKDTWNGSLDSLAPLGTMVSFGNASGAVPPFSPLVLSQKGSLFLTRPTLGHYTATRADLLASANELFDVVRRGVVKVEIGQRFALREAAEAHRALESRATTGSTILLA